MAPSRAPSSPEVETSSAGAASGTATASSKKAQKAITRAARAKILPTPTLILLILTLIFTLAALALTVLVHLASTSANFPLYFLRLDLRTIFPSEIQNSQLITSIAQSIGLRDFYQIGLWSFCSGYFHPDIIPGINTSSALLETEKIEVQQGFDPIGTVFTSKGDPRIGYCSEPKVGWWFDPVEIISGDVLAGATIVLPEEVSGLMDILQGASVTNANLWLAGGVLATAATLSVAGLLAITWLQARKAAVHNLRCEVVSLAPRPIKALLIVTLILLICMVTALFAAAILSTTMFLGGAEVLRSRNEVAIGVSTGGAMVMCWCAAACALVAGITGLWVFIRLWRRAKRYRLKGIWMAEREREEREAARSRSDEGTVESKA